MKTHKVLKVEWTDPANYGGWKHRRETKDFEPCSCLSVGILTKTKRGSIGLIQSLDLQEGKCAETMVIPRKAITKTEVISTFKK